MANEEATLPREDLIARIESTLAFWQGVRQRNPNDPVACQNVAKYHRRLEMVRHDT